MRTLVLALTMEEFRTAFLSYKWPLGKIISEYGESQNKDSVPSGRGVCLHAFQCQISICLLCRICMPFTWFCTAATSTLSPFRFSIWSSLFSPHTPTGQCSGSTVTDLQQWWLSLTSTEIAVLINVGMTFRSNYSPTLSAWESCQKTPCWSGYIALSTN